MGLGIHIRAELEEKRISTGKNKAGGYPVFNELEKYFNNRKKNRLFDFINVEKNGRKLCIQLHPAEEPVEFFLDENNNIICSAKTNSAGPGYHAYLVELLEDSGKDLNIGWNWQNEGNMTGDETGYYHDKNYFKLQRKMEDWLKRTAEIIIEKDLENIKISLPLYFPDVIKDHFAISSLGYFDREWFLKVSKSSDSDLTGYSKNFFPWWNEDIDADFWLKTALVLLWIECPWHFPINENEKKIYILIDHSLENSYMSDKNQAFPWDDWIEILKYLGNKKKIELIKKRNNGKAIKSTGFRKEMLEFCLTDNWKITLPGCFYHDLENDDSTEVFWYENRTVRVSSLSLEMKDKNKKSGPEDLLKNFFRDIDKKNYIEIFELEINDLIGIFGLKYIDDEKDRYWMITGSFAKPNKLCIVTVCFEDKNDEAWAKEIIKTVKHAG